MIKGKLDRRSVIGRELQDVTVGLLGTGRIGALVAEAIYHMGDMWLPLVGVKILGWRGLSNMCPLRPWLLHRTSCRSISRWQKHQKGYFRPLFLHRWSLAVVWSIRHVGNRWYGCVDCRTRARAFVWCCIRRYRQWRTVFFSWVGSKSLLSTAESTAKCAFDPAYCVLYPIGCTRNCRNSFEQCKRYFARRTICQYDRALSDRKERVGVCCKQKSKDWRSLSINKSS